MTKRMMLAALLVLGAVPALAGDVSSDRQSQSGSSWEAWVAAAKRIEAKRIEAQSAEKKHTCSCERPAS